MANSIVSSIVKTYKGRAIRIREDKYVCLTDMAAASGKLFGHWHQLKGTAAYLTALSETIGIPIVDLIEVQEGRDGGSWAHPKVAIKFAAWCSPQFEVQITVWIDELLTTGSVSIAPQAPTTYIEALKALVQAEEEKQRLEQQAQLQAAQIGLLEEETERQAEIIDELFDYSSIVRIAKYNKIDEKQFNWRQLKSASLVLQLEIKVAPCPRFGTKNLYHHDVWRLAYPGVALPETTTLVLAAVN